MTVGRLHDLLIKDQDLEITVADFKESGTSPKALKGMDQLAERINNSLQPVESGLPMMAAPALAYARANPERAAQSGGLMGIAAREDDASNVKDLQDRQRATETVSLRDDMKLIKPQQPMPMQQAAIGGGVRNFEGQVPGQGHGMEDNVFMPIVERNRGQQVATLAVSPDEYVVDAHTMSALGNGSADAGAKVMDNVVDSVRKKAYGTDQQPNEINGLAALRPMIERV
jgi:hypothetical protein